MNLTTVYLSYTAKISAIFTVIVLLGSIFSASFALASEVVPAASSTPIIIQTEIETNICLDDAALNYDQEGYCQYATPTPTTPEEPVKYACEIEGHKYDEKGVPQMGWTMGLMKVIKFADSEAIKDLASNVTDKDGYFCLEWDGYTNTEVIVEPHSFTYRVYEVIKEGWSFFNVEEGKDVPNLKEVADEDIKEANGRVSVQIGEENGYIFANAEHHVDFYNKKTVTEIDPCVVTGTSTDTLLLQTTLTNTPTTTDPCGGDNGGENGGGNGGGGNGGGGNGGGGNTDGGNGGGGDNSGNGRNGGNSGTRIKRAPVGEVLGGSTSTPAGMVLGEATSAMPMGAPNTGAGGTAPVTVSLPTLVAILSTTTRRIK